MNRDPPPIDYGRADRLADGSWFAQRRLGASSLACTAVAFLVVAAVLAASALSTRPDLTPMALAAGAGVVVLLFGGGMTGIVGVDHDRRRGLAVAGAALNFTLLLALVYLIRR